MEEEDVMGVKGVDVEGDGKGVSVARTVKKMN